MPTGRGPNRPAAVPWSRGSSRSSRDAASSSRRSGATSSAARRRAGWPSSESTPTSTGRARRDARGRTSTPPASTITVLGEKLLPPGPLPLKGYDLVFFVSGNVEAARSARSARFVAATARELPTLREAGIALDLLVGSATDAAERYDGSLRVRHLAATDGANGGTLDGEPYEAAPAGRVVDTYGAGDSFAAALAFALARGDDAPAAAAFAARAGAAVIGGAGPYDAQLAFPA